MLGAGGLEAGGWRLGRGGRRQKAGGRWRGRREEGEEVIEGGLGGQEKQEAYTWM